MDISPDRKYQAKLRFYETAELLTAIDAVSFADAWRESIETNVGDLKLRVLSRAHLIASKQHSLREIDADDVKALEGPGFDSSQK